VTIVVAIVAVMMIAVAMLFLPLMTSEVFNPSVVSVPLGTIVVIGVVAVVPIPRVEATIYMSAKMLTVVVPRSRSDERAVRKPFRAIVAIGSARIRLVVVVPIGARGFCSKLNTETYLCRGFLRRRQKANSGHCGQSKIFESLHDSSLLLDSALASLLRLKRRAVQLLEPRPN
jgi:hypothetical protein